MGSIRSKFLAGGALALASSLACAADLSAFANSAGLAIKAATLSDAEVVDLANKSKEKLSRTGLVTLFQKLAKLEGSDHSMFSSHPSSPDRAQHIQSRIDEDG